MAIDDHSRALAVDVFNQIITDIKESRPTRSDGSSTSGFVYAQMFPGELISPRDFARPWQPGGAKAAPAPIAGAPLPPGIPSPPPTPAETSAEVQRAMMAAFRTAEKFDRLLMVTNDGTTQPYGGGGRRLSVQYDAIIHAMAAPPAEPRPEEEQKRIDAATATLFGEDGNPTPTYQRYLDNQDAYAEARSSYVREELEISADPVLGPQAPVLLKAPLAKVQQAFDRWKSQQAEEIEAALATRGSLGVPLEQGMIDTARTLLEQWKVALAPGIAAETPYTFISPSEWCEIDADDIGWARITRTAKNYSEHFDSHGYGLSTGNWSGTSSSTSGSAGVSVFGFGFGGTYAEADSQNHHEYSTTGNDGSHFTNDATDLTVELQYGLIEIVRPWLTTDLFHMKNWKVEGEKKYSISDGTIDGQVLDDERRLPMIPTHALVVRNVAITTDHWGTVKDTLNSSWNTHHDADSSGSSSVSANASIPVWGPLSLTGGFSHSDSRYAGDFKDEHGNDVRNDSGSFFEGDTLHINGAQIVAMLGEIIPASAPQDG